MLMLVWLDATLALIQSLMSGPSGRRTTNREVHPNSATPAPESISGVKVAPTTGEEIYFDHLVTCGVVEPAGVAGILDSVATGMFITAYSFTILIPKTAICRINIP